MKMVIQIEDLDQDSKPGNLTDDQIKIMERSISRR